MDKIEASHLEFLKKFPGAGGSMATQGQPAPSRPTRYQLVNLILDSESKDKPWVLGSTQVIPHSQLTTMKMWLESGGAFSDVEEPIRYIKTLCDMQTFLAYQARIDAKIATARTNGTQITFDILVDTLDSLVTDRMPLSVRHVKYLRCGSKTGQMGSRGAKVVEYFRELNKEVNSASIPTLDWRSLTIFTVLGDLDAGKLEEILLSNHILSRWNEFQNSGKIFDLPACESTIIKWWAERKEAEGLIGGSSNKAGGESDRPPKRKGRGRKNTQNKKGKQDQETVAAAKETQPPAGAGNNNKPYCFRCGDLKHLAVACPKKGNLSCERHTDKVSHTKEAC